MESFQSDGYAVSLAHEEVEAGFIGLNGLMTRAEVEPIACRSKGHMTWHKGGRYSKHLKEQGRVVVRV